MGALDYLSNFCSVTETRRSLRKKRRPLQTVELKVKMDCDGCERRVKHAVTSLKARALMQTELVGPGGHRANRGQNEEGHLIESNLNLSPTKVEIIHHPSNTLGGPNALSSSSESGIVSGVTMVDVNRKQSRVTVTGHVEPKKVLNKVKSTGKRVEFWPYIPYNLVYYPYAAQAYDKRAPSGFVRNVDQAVPSPGAPEEQFTSLFSDDNPNACSIM